MVPADASLSSLQFPDPLHDCAEMSCLKWNNGGSHSISYYTKRRGIVCSQIDPEGHLLSELSPCWNSSLL